MTQADLEKFKQILLGTKADLQKELGHHPLISDMGTDTEGQSFDEEADEAEEVPVNYGIRAALKERLAAVEEALQKLEAGQFGQCQHCRGPIEEVVLTVAPTSLYCRGCKVKL